jgi:hypothetical protein
MIEINELLTKYTSQYIGNQLMIAIALDGQK